jgi:hypothetical protein
MLNMDLLKLYFYTGVPIITCNMLFYSVSAISTSITSSQNVVKFISEHKKTDTSLFHDEIEKHDLLNKLSIIEAVLQSIIKKCCHSTDEYNTTIKYIKHTYVEEHEQEHGFMLVKLTNNTVLDRLDEPIKLALVSTSEIVQKINDIILNAQDKINNHDNSYLNKFRPIPLQEELTKLQKCCPLLDSRIQLLFELLKVYRC